MRPVFVLLTLFWLMLSSARAQNAAEVNLSLRAQSAIPTASDSIDGNYNYLAGNVADDNPDTAWVTGRDMREHWAHLQWRNVSVTAGRVEIDFSPLKFSYQPPKMFGEKASPFPFEIATGKPQALQLEIHTEAKWQTLHSFAQPITWRENVAVFAPARPLARVRELRLTLRSTPGQNFAVRELKVFGPKTPSSFAMRPKWKGVWLWGEPEPQLAGYGVVKRYFRRVFEVKDAADIASAKILFVAHDRGRVWLNGTLIAQTANPGKGMNRELARREVEAALFKTGPNVLAIEGEDVDEVGLRGVLAELWLQKRDSTFETIFTEPNSVTVSSFAETGWNANPTGFADWPKARALNTPNHEVEWAWSFDYSPAYFSGEVQVTNVDLEPKIPRPGDEFTLAVGVKAALPLDDDYGLLATYGETGAVRVSYADFNRGESFVPPANALPKGFQGEKKITVSGVWPAGVTPRLPVQLRFVNPTRQLEILASPIGEITSGAQPGRLKTYLGTPPVAYAKSGFPEVKTSGGRLTIDGVPTPPMLYTSSLQTPVRYAEYAPSGISLFRILPAGIAGVVADEGDEEVTHARLLDSIALQVEAIHSMQQNAKFLIMLELDMPNDWKFAHPEEIITLGDGRRLIPINARNHSVGYIQETPNSKAVLKKVEESLHKFVTRLEQQPYANSIIGFSLTQGRAGENYWGLDANISQDEKGDWIIPERSRYFFGDFGVAARQNFRDWLKEKYKTKEGLAKAWQTPGMDFEDVTSAAKWPNEKFVRNLMWRDRPEGRFMFRDRTAEGSLYHDYVSYMNSARASLMLRAGKAIKEASRGRLLAGGYIGYALPALTNSPPGMAQHSGHQALRMLLESPYIDYMSSPHFYHMRRAGDPIMPMGITDSLRVHNKLWMNEYDSRSFLSPIPPKTFSQTETLEQFQKEFGNAITRDQGWWWYEFNFDTVGARAPSWFSDPAMLRDASTMRRIYETYLKNTPQTTPSSEIAVFVNAEQPYYTDAYSPGNTVHSNVVNQLIPRLSMLGAPYDIYAQSDLPTLKARGQLANYKLILFVNSFHLSTEERAIINTDLKRDGKTLLFFFAPGYQGNTGEKTELSLNGIEEVTGMKGINKLAQTHLMGLTLNTQALVKDIPQREFDAIAWESSEQIENYGNPIGPVFYLDQAQSNGWTPLATLRLDKKEAADKTALAMHKSDNHTVIYSVLPDLPTGVLTAIAQNSGVHIYSRPGILTWGNRDFLCVSSGREAKQLVLKAKGSVNWIEPFERKAYARSTSTLTIDLAPGETKFFCLERNSEWQSFMAEVATH